MGFGRILLDYYLKFFHRNLVWQLDYIDVATVVGTDFVKEIKIFSLSKLSVNCGSELCILITMGE